VRPNRCALGVALLVTGALLAACSGGGERSSEAKSRSVPETEERQSEAATVAGERKVPGCGRVEPAWERRLPPREFFPPSLAGLWLRDDRCVYLVVAGSKEARALWRARPGERVLGLGWAPDGESFVVTTGARVLLLGRDGSLRRRLRATGAAFLRDGRLAVSRGDGIYLLAGARSRRLASREQLGRIAGFRPRRTLFVGHDPWGFTRGHGRDALALTLWSGGGSWKSIVLVVSAAGRVMRASPAYRAGGGEGVVSGWAWAPDGRELFVMSEVAGPPERRARGNHDHCLDIWSAQRGLRRSFCESRLSAAHWSHFAKLAWAADGKTALLDNGTVVTRDGNVAGRSRPAHGDLSFQLQWEPRHR
jgi:hypothetical protein